MNLHPSDPGYPPPPDSSSDEGIVSLLTDNPQHSTTGPRAGIRSGGGGPRAGVITGATPTGAVVPAEPRSGDPFPLTNAIALLQRACSLAQGVLGDVIDDVDVDPSRAGRIYILEARSSMREAAALLARAGAELRADRSNLTPDLGAKGAVPPSSIGRGGATAS